MSCCSEGLRDCRCGTSSLRKTLKRAELAAGKGEHKELRARAADEVEGQMLVLVVRKIPASVQGQSRKDIVASTLGDANDALDVAVDLTHAKLANEDLMLRV